MNIVLKSAFRPFTYDELVKPVIQYKNEYDKVEADYSTLAAQTEAWKNIADQEKSPQAYAMYQRYAQELDNVVTDFSKGMTMGNRSQLLNMKRRYASDIQPIATAYQKQQALAEEQRKAMAANPTMRYERYASNMSLDDFINDPAIDYGRSYSGALLTKQVSEAAANFKKQMTDVSNLEKLGLPFQYQRLIRRGYSPDAVFAAMADDAQAGDSQAARALRGIVDQVMDASGVGSWADNQTLRELRGFANQGLYSAIGDSQIETFKDDYSASVALARERANLDLQVAAAKAKLKGEEGGSGNKHYRTVPYTSVDASKKTSELNKKIEMLRELMANPSLIEKTEEVRNPAGDFAPPGAGSVYSGARRRDSSGARQTKRPYQDLLNELSRTYGITIGYENNNGNITFNGFEEAIGQLQRDIKGSATRNMIYTPNTVDDELAAKSIGKNIMLALQLNEDAKVGYEFKNGKKGAEIKSSNLSKMNADNTSISYIPSVGITLTSVDDKGKLHSVLLDPEILENEGSDRTVKGYMDNVNTLLDMRYYEEAQDEIENLMEFLYGKFNSHALTQTTSASPDKIN